jgi:ComF family protein
VNGLLDLVYPRQCAGCGAALSEEPGHLCLDCLSSNYLISRPFCQICGEPVSGRVDHAYTCHQCSDVIPHYDRARAAAQYEGPIREAIQNYKYRQALWLQADLTQLLVALAHVEFAEESVDAIMPVPLHRRRRRSRGFNQSELLAKGLGREIKVPLMLKNLVRIRYTITQTSLSANARMNNVHGAFATRHETDIAGKRILLLDDVMTTGATLSECARVLKNAGASFVVAFAVARG